MRIVFLFIALSLAITLSAQSNFVNQVKNIFEDASNNFLKYKGTQKPSLDTASAYYNTTITIDGTIDNDIFRDQLGYMYSAVIKDWVSKKEAKRIVEGWKMELKDNFWPFKQQKEKSFTGVFSEDYIFKKNAITLAFCIVLSGDNKNYLVTLHISYYKEF